MDWGYPWAPHLRIFSDEHIGEVPIQKMNHDDRFYWRNKTWCWGTPIVNIRQPSVVPLSSPEPFAEYRLLAWKPFTNIVFFCMFLQCKSMPVLLMHEKNMKNPYPGLYTQQNLPKQLEDVEDTNINSCGARAFSDPTIEPIHHDSSIPN